LTRTSGENAGSYTISQGTINNENNPNYSITFECNRLYVISKRDVKIVVDDKEIIYGDSIGTIVYYLSHTNDITKWSIINRRKFLGDSK
jgi:hypothetical protein